MYTIIGLGISGCNLAELFEVNQKFKVKLLDSEIEGDNCFSIPVQKSSEDYEKHTPDLTNFFKDVSEKVIFIIDGSTKIAGCSLQVLKQIRDREITILYLRSDVELMNNIGKMQDRLSFNVLQEYARSGLFKSAVLISIPLIENILGDVPIAEYSANINKILYNSITAIVNFESDEPVIDNSSPPKEVSRIMTYGVYDIESDVERLFYDLDFIDDKCYYFGINETELKTNNKLFRLIRERMREKTLDNTKISYRIHSTSYEQSFCYVAAWSRKVQE